MSSRMDQNQTTPSTSGQGARIRSGRVFGLAAMRWEGEKQPRGVVMVIDAESRLSKNNSTMRF